MIARQTDWPRTWLMTDERMGKRLWHAIDRLPEKSGIVVRHYGLEPSARAELARRIAGICRKRGFTLAVARDVEMALSLGADLVHNPPEPATDLPFSQSVHSLEEAKKAKAEGAALVFVSPVFATRSHPGREPLGPELALKIAHATGATAIALGGMNAARFAQLERDGFHGWAGIDAWLGDEDVRT